jgi:chromosome partitioning protein
MRTIAVVNQKGGTGKTTTSVSLGATLAERGKKVLLVDLDPQHSTTTWLATHAPGRGVFDLFAAPEETHLSALVQPTATANLQLVAASPWLVGAEKALASVPGAETIFREKVAALPAGSYDYLLVDCPPTLGILTANALTAVTEMLVPVECHVMGLQGLAQLLQTVDLVRRRLNPSLLITGILACRLDNRTNHGPEIVEKLRARFPETLSTVIRENVRLAECPSMGEPITAYAPGSPGAEDYRALAEEIILQEKQEAYAKAENE